METSTNNPQFPEWNPGDPVATQAMHHANREITQKYHLAVHENLVKSWVNSVLSKPSLEERRSFLAKCPHSLRSQVEFRVKQLWRQRKAA